MPRLACALGSRARARARWCASRGDFHRCLRDRPSFRVLRDVPGQAQHTPRREHKAARRCPAAAAIAPTPPAGIPEPEPATRPPASVLPTASAGAAAQQLRQRSLPAQSRGSRAAELPARSAPRDGWSCWEFRAAAAPEGLRGTERMRASAGPRLHGQRAAQGGGPPARCAGHAAPPWLLGLLGLLGLGPTTTPPSPRPQTCRTPAWSRSSAPGATCRQGGRASRPLGCSAPGPALRSAHAPLPPAPAPRRTTASA
jgi:hypothetical protein